MAQIHLRPTQAHLAVDRALAALFNFGRRLTQQIIQPCQQLASGWGQRPNTRHLQDDPPPDHLSATLSHPLTLSSVDGHDAGYAMGIWLLMMATVFAAPL